MPRAQCIVTRGNRILMAKHGMNGLEWWCLPGGGIEPKETPEEAALRELQEECHVTGRIVRKANVSADLESDTSAFSFHVDIGTQEPVLGDDPDLPEGREQVLRDIKWLTLSEIPERDRAFLWSAGLLAVPGFWSEVEKWGGDLSYPTPETRLTGIPDIDATLKTLESRVRGILHENLVGLYMYGSLATGGFDPESSDIDFVAATFRAPGEAEAAALESMHARLAKEGKWGTKLEGAYIPVAALQKHNVDNARHLFLSADTPFGWNVLDADWVINRYVLREHGVTVYGPPPSLLIDRVAPAELAGAVKDLLNGFWHSCLDRPAFLRSRRYQAFAILTMCRALRALETGEYVSKRDAASWTMNAVEPKWIPLITRALRWQADPNLDEAGLVETLEFIHYTIQRSQDPNHTTRC